jgi:hypothetical protein
LYKLLVEEKKRWWRYERNLLGGDIAQLHAPYPSSLCRNGNQSIKPVFLQLGAFWRLLVTF